MLFILPGIIFAQGYKADNPDSLKSKQSHRNIYLQFNMSGLLASLSDWSTSLHLSDGSHPSTGCIVFGGEAGIVVSRFLQIGAGYEFFFTTKATTLEAGGDQIEGTFFYGSLKAGSTLKSVPELYLFGGLDIGSISVTETMENYVVTNFERGGSAAAFRITGGAQYYVSENWSISAAAGYQSADIRKVTAYGSTISNFTLDFSGLILRGAVSYHIPL